MTGRVSSGWEIVKLVNYLSWRYCFSSKIATLEEMTILENISPDTLVFLQTHKRIWPASQRDALFWSHMKNVKDNVDTDAHDVWIVCNHSIEHEDYPVSGVRFYIYRLHLLWFLSFDFLQPANIGKCVRIFLTVILVCQTYVSPNKTNDDKISRDDLTCKITYCSVGKLKNILNCLQILMVIFSFD